MKKVVLAMLAMAWMLGALPAQAHFGMIIPERNLVDKEDPKSLGLQFRFWHPMENQGLDLGRPQEAGYLLDGRKVDLLPALKEVKVQGHPTWAGSLALKKPGDYTLYMTPPAYFEPSEDKFIIHYTKTVVGVLNKQEGWDQPLGQKVEIVPLTRPYGLYAGNCFSGQALFKGKPLAHARVEVEFFNSEGKRKAPKEAHVSQVVKTDGNGYFSWSLPWPGWWGFAALTEDDQPLQKDGRDKKVELGGILWIYAHPVK
jgi:cobalt/nickel transport protein